MFILLKDGTILEVFDNDPVYKIRGNYLEYQTYHYDKNGQNEKILTKKELILKFSRKRQEVNAFKKRYSSYLDDTNKPKEVRL